MCLHQCTYCVHIKSQNTFVATVLRWGMGKFRKRFGVMGRFKVRLRCKGWVNSEIINVIT